MTQRTRFLSLIFFLTAAVIIRFGIAPLLERLPVNYTNRIDMVQDNQIRNSNTDDWQKNRLVLIRRDQTIMKSNEISFIEGSLSVYYDTGDVNFEISNRYGVDAITRQNMPGLGNVDRDGQYLFPPHTKQTDYTIWDPMYNGPCQTHFERIDQIDGVIVYVFSFTTSGLDESDGYSYLPDVPEKFYAHTDGQGTIWVEPVSGFVVNYQDSGLSYFVSLKGGVPLDEFNRWNNTYTQETQAAQLELARNFRAKTVLFRDILPTSLVLAGLVWFLVGWVAWRKKMGKS